MTTGEKGKGDKDQKEDSLGKHHDDCVSSELTPRVPVTTPTTSVTTIAKNITMRATPQVGSLDGQQSTAHV